LSDDEFGGASPGWLHRQAAAFGYHLQFGLLRELVSDQPTGSSIGQIKCDPLEARQRQLLAEPDDTNTAATKTVPVPTKAATKATEQENDEENNKDGSE
jgi:hypothetical protein